MGNICKGNPPQEPAISKVREHKIFVPRCELKIVNVIDGDTVKVCGIVDNELFHWNLRIEGIDAPETRKAKTPNEKLHGEASKSALSTLISYASHVRVIQNFKKLDKFGGRLLGDIELTFVNGKTLASEWMLKNNFAVPYSGKKKADRIYSSTPKKMVCLMTDDNKFLLNNNFRLS